MMLTTSAKHGVIINGGGETCQAAGGNGGELRGIAEGHLVGGGPQLTSNQKGKKCHLWQKECRRSLGIDRNTLLIHLADYRG
jgi:hypothetical protein